MSLALRIRSNRPWVAAHAGGSAQAPENTLAAFRRAHKQGVVAVELDVRLSADDVPVVIHDATLRRTAGVPGLVGKRTAQELRGLDVGGWFAPEFAGEPVPLLDEVLAWAKGKVFLHIEVKNSARYESAAERVVELVRQRAMEKMVEVLSFDYRLARRVKALSPSLMTGVCYSRTPAHPVALAQRARAGVLHPHWRCVRAEDVQAAHHAGLLVIPWTVNEPEVARRLVRMGVDGLITDAPLRIKRALRLRHEWR